MSNQSVDKEELHKFYESAKNHFREEKYAEATKEFQKLSDLLPNNLKIYHNMTISEFHKTKFCGLEAFEKSANKFKGKLLECEEVEKEKRFCDHALVLYNLAVFYFYVHHYEKAIDLLMLVRNSLDQVNNVELQVNIIFLLCDCYIFSYRSDKVIHSALIEAESKLTVLKERESGNIEKLSNRLYILKANMYLATKNLKACKKEIKLLSNNISHGVPAAFIRSNYEYWRHNYKKSLKLLHQGISQYRSYLETGECVPALYYNNMACIHFQLKKKNLAMLFFKKAFNEIETLMQSQTKGKKAALSMQCVSTMRRSEMQYNLGCVYLQSGHPEQAFDCLVEAIQVYYNNPRLWLRLAECCIAVHQKHQQAQNASLPYQSIGQGIHHKLLIKSFEERKSHDVQSSAFPVASLGFGSLCAQNALLLIQSAMESKSEVIDAKPGGSIKANEITYLKASVLACSAYIYLILGNFMKTYHQATELVNMQKIPGSLKFVGTMYLAEALLQMDQIPEAIQLLSPDRFTDLSVGNTSHDDKHDRTESPSLDADQRQSMHECYPPSLNAARQIVFANLAYAHAIRAEFEKARKCLFHVSTILPTEVPLQVVMLAVYIELKCGNTNLGIQILRRRQIPKYVTK